MMGLTLTLPHVLEDILTLPHVLEEVGETEDDLSAAALNNLGPSLLAPLDFPVEQRANIGFEEEAPVNYPRKTEIGKKEKNEKG